MIFSSTSPFYNRNDLRVRFYDATSEGGSITPPNSVTHLDEVVTHEGETVTNGAE